MNIYLLRHGETDWNKEGRIQGHTDILLNQNGRMQISHAADILTDLEVNIDVIITSPLSRARESAEIAAHRLAYHKENIVVEPMLIERSFGDAEGLTVAEREAKYPNYHYSDIHYHFVGMESFEDLMNRAHCILKKIVNTYKDKQNILVVSHGAILAAIITAITDGKITYFEEKIQLDSASLHLIKYQNGAVELAGYCTENSGFKDIAFG